MVATYFTAQVIVFFFRGFFAAILILIVNIYLYYILKFTTIQFKYVFEY